MIGRIVITAVPRGLDGGTGFQPVMRTQGLRPSIAERLAMRSVYPHPYPFGDPRNPHLFFHRIELVGDRTIHVLGSVRDAGASYTGRSNYLADVIAVDPSETRGLHGGPAHAAATFPWMAAWSGEPREVPLNREPSLPSRDPDDPATTGRPATCPEWQRATGDAGWAGELAKSFLDGRRALIWAGDGVDVRALFVEALRLLPTQVRWQVTFNTCEIEPFPAHWRAVRPDLGLVGNYDPKNELRLVLGKLRDSSNRAPDHELSRRARGELIAPTESTQTNPPRAAASGTPVSPPPHPGHTAPQSAPNDDLLQEQLRDIRESRQRRSGAASGAQASDTVQRPRMAFHTTQLWGIFATALTLGSIGLCWFGVMAMYYPGWFPGWPRNSPEVSLRSDNNRTTGSRRQPSDTAEPGQEPSTDHAAQPIAPVPTPPALPSQSPAKKHSNKSPQDDPEDKSRRAFDRFKELSLFHLPTKASVRTPHPKPSPVAIDLGRPEERSEEAKPSFTFGAKGFAAADLDPALECQVLCPYEEQHRLTCEQLRPDTWAIKGISYNIGDLHAVESTGSVPQEICRLTITNESITATFLVKENHPLYRRLQNSLVTLTATNPDNPADRASRDLHFSVARDSSEIAQINLCLFKETDKSGATFSSSITDRLRDVPPSRILYELECWQPPYDTQPLLIRKEPNSEPQSQLLICPPKGVKIELHLVTQSKNKPEPDKWKRRKGTLFVTGTFAARGSEHDPLTIHFTPAVDSNALSDVLQIKRKRDDWLAWLRELHSKKFSKDQMTDWLMKIQIDEGKLKDVDFAKFMETKDDKSKTIYFNAFTDKNAWIVPFPDWFEPEIKIENRDDLIKVEIQRDYALRYTKNVGENYPKNPGGAGLTPYTDQGNYDKRRQEIKNLKEKLEAISKQFAESESLVSKLLVKPEINTIVTDLVNSKLLDGAIIKLKRLSLLLDDERGLKLDIVAPPP